MQTLVYCTHIHIYETYRTENKIRMFSKQTLMVQVTIVSVQESSEFNQSEANVSLKHIREIIAEAEQLKAEYIIPF